MTRDEIVSLLSVATAYDGRTLGEADVAAWGDAAERGRWTYDQAQDAVKGHYAESAAWLMPAHVTERIKAARSEPPRSHALPRATPRPASDEYRDRVADWLAERLRWDRDERNPRENRDCLSIACPHCGARADRPCWQTAGHRPLTHKPPIEIPHLYRRKAYRYQE